MTKLRPVEPQADAAAVLTAFASADDDLLRQAPMIEYGGIRFDTVRMARLASDPAPEISPLTVA